MKNFTCTLLLLFSFSLVNSQIDLTPAQWQEDLRFLQEKVHDDYSTLFRKITAEEFDAAVDNLHKEIPKLSDDEVVIRLKELVALFGYGHTSMSIINWSGKNKTGFGQLPLQMYWFSDGLYIQGIHKKYQDQLGAKVLKIGKLTAEEAMEAVRPVVSAENESFFKAYGVYYLAIPEVLKAKGIVDSDKKVPFLLEKDGREQWVDLEPMAIEKYPLKYNFIQQQGDWLDARNTADTPLWLKKLDRIYFYEYLPESKTLYVRHSQIQDDPQQTIPQFYDEVFDFAENNEVDKLVLDFRLNGGGNNYKNKPIVTGIIKTKKINQPGKLFVIIGRYTYSACQNLVNELDNYTNAVFVGEPTAENINFLGDNRAETLPNSQLSVRLSFAWWQDKPQWENAEWTTPRLAAELSFDDYVNNHDPAMEAIMEYKHEAPIVERMEAMYRKGEVEQLKKMVSDYINDPKHKYNDIEARVNSFGYQLINNKNYEEAINVFTLNTEFFPQSPNAWDSLAESYWRAGNKEKARELYQKAISLDPDGRIGDNARNMLKQMEKGH